MNDKYRAVFINEMGLEVLADILRECHFGETLDPDNKVQVAEYNVGIMIMAKCGVFSPANLHNAIRALCSIPIKMEETSG